MIRISGLLIETYLSVIECCSSFLKCGSNKYNAIFEEENYFFFLVSGSKTLGFICLFEDENGLISVFVMFVWLLLLVCYMVCLTLFKSFMCYMFIKSWLELSKVLFRCFGTFF